MGSCHRSVEQCSIVLAYKVRGVHYSKGLYIGRKPVTGGGGEEDMYYPKGGVIIRRPVATGGSDSMLVSV